MSHRPRPFYSKWSWKDWDAKTRDLDAFEYTAYHRLLSFAVTTSPDLCSVPNDDIRLARASGLGLKKWRQVRPRVVTFFDEETLPTGEVRLVSRRLREDAILWTQHVEKQRKRRQSGRPAVAPEGDPTRSRENQMSESEERALSKDRAKPQALENGQAGPGTTSDKSSSGEAPTGLLDTVRAIVDRAKRPQADIVAQRVAEADRQLEAGPASGADRVTYTTPRHRMPYADQLESTRLEGVSARRSGRSRLVTTADVFDTGLVDRLAAQFGPRGVDVYLIATDVRDWCLRKPGRVRNASAVLVTRVHAAASPRPTQLEISAELERYAVHQVAMFRAIAVEQLSPSQLAERLEAARTDGYPKLNPRVIEQLRAMGGWRTP